MRIYRALKRLSTGHERGELVLEPELAAGAISILLERGILAVASGPPLAELPGWKIRAARLAQMGITTIEELLDADDEEVALKFKLKRQDTVGQWRGEALGWLGPPVKRKCRRC